ncbi:hypothetical protein ACLMJK_001959 [Lecanora helva]
MKFLCLHGMGTNSSIFESQLSSTIPYLEAQGHEFVFVDGLVECAPVAEIGSFFPGPYLCYYNLPTHDLVKQAQAYIEEIIEDEGPFDGVIGFSQGAALAASIILEHAKKNPFEDVFKLAIFAGASLPFELSSNTSVFKRPFMQREESDSSESSFEEEDSSTVNRPFLGREDSDSSELSSDDEVDPYTSWRIPRNFYHPVGPLLGRYHPERTPKAQLRQPTLHLIGDQDEYNGQAQMLVKLCTGQTTVIHHPEGHRIPREKGFHDKTSRAIEHLISRVNLTC